MPLRGSCNSCNSVKPKSQQRFLSGDKSGPIFRDAFLALLSVLNTVISSRAAGISVWCHSRNWLFVFSVKSYPWPPIFFLKKNLVMMLFLQGINLYSEATRGLILYQLSILNWEKKYIRIWYLETCRWNVWRRRWLSEADILLCSCFPWLTFGQQRCK